MNGIHTLSAGQYFAAEGVSRSMLETLITKSPKHFHAEHIANTVPKEETAAMRLGSLTHRFILEPDTVEDAFHAKPDGMSFTTKEGKAWREEHSDRPIISSDEAACIIGMRKAVHSHAVASSFIKGAQTEKCLFAQDGHGTLRKARLDLIPGGGNTLADLKTCADASEFAMSKAMDARGYHRQAAFTLELCRLLGMEQWQNWCLICVESAPPFDIVVWPIDEDAMRMGRMEIEGAIQTYRHCLKTGEWPGLEGILAPLRERSLPLPPWKQKQALAA